MQALMQLPNVSLHQIYMITVLYSYTSFHPSPKWKPALILYRSCTVQLCKPACSSFRMLSCIYFIWELYCIAVQASMQQLPNAVLHSFCIAVGTIELCKPAYSQHAASKCKPALILYGSCIIQLCKPAYSQHAASKCKPALILYGSYTIQLCRLPPKSQMRTCIDFVW